MLIPRINDITTSFVQPPQFQEIARLRSHVDYSYPSSFESQQRQYYGELAPLVTEMNPSNLWDQILKVAQQFERWEIFAQDDSSHRLECVAVTKWVRFRDDIVIEVRKESGASRAVHMRSRSRLGKSDFGANAARIREFFKRLKGSL